MSLVVSNLTIARGGLRLLEGVSFKVAAGEALVLRGENGIGKTTLLRTIAGLQPPVSGQVDVAADTVAYASHADGIKGQLSVLENLSFWAQVYGQPPVQAQVLEAFDLCRLRDRPAAQLSAGQKRRLGLARLGVIARRGLLLDEPTVSLDTASVARFGEFVGAHLAAGGFAVIATHIELGFATRVLDLSAFKAVLADLPDFDEAFL
ncbi:MAG: heme exporter protein A [Paracoccaceae bacterium]|jgi:heme exporter protein A